jgi:hypothetical protein
MATEKQFLDITGLEHFWDKAQAVIGTMDATTLQSAQTYADDAAAAVKAELIGTADDAATAVTINGVKKYVDGKDADVNDRIDTLIEEIEADEKVHAAAYTDLNGRVTNLENSKDAYIDADTAVKNELIGTTNDDETADTIKGAKKYVDAAIASVINNAPESFDTLKEIAEWIANNNHAEDVAGLVTDVANLKKIDHNAYVSADTAVKTALIGTTNDTASNDTIKGAKKYADAAVSTAITGLDGITSGSGDYVKSVTQTDGKVTVTYATLPTYETKGAAATVKAELIGTDNDTASNDTIKGVKKYTDAAVAELTTEIENNEETWATAFTNIDDRVKELEEIDHDAYKAADDAVKTALIGTASDTASNDTIKGAKKYTDAAVNAISAIPNTTIDGLF